LKNTRNNKLTTLPLILILTVAALITLLPAVQAGDFPTYGYITVAPNPIGVGQQATIIAWLDKVPPTAGLIGLGDRWQNYTIEVTKPNGSKETLGPFTSDPVGSMYTFYTPTEIGTYTFQFSFPGQTIQLFGNYYKPSTSAIISLTVQQEAIGNWPGADLPTGYWERPINAENREWYTIGGNYLGTGGSSFGAHQYNSTGNFMPYTTAPNSPHILWTEEITFGGIMGGEFGGGGTSSYYHGMSYEPKFTPPVIIQGRLYYNQFIAGLSSTRVVCIDIRTGAELWVKEDMYITNGQIYNYISPNQYGGCAYLWDTSGTTWHMYDAFTGEWILDIANATGGEIVMSPAGDMLVYVLNGANNWLAMWNSSSIPQMLPGPLGSGTAGWQWRPPAGATLDWKDGIQWNVTVPDVAGVQSIPPFNGMASYILFASTATIFGASPGWEIAVAYDAHTGEQLWVENRTIPLGATAWQLNGPVGEGVICQFHQSTMEWYGFDLYTGEKLWGPTEPYEDAWGMYQTGAMIAYGKLYALHVDGLHCYDVHTGEHLWDYIAGPSGLETIYPNWPFDLGGFSIADGKVFIVSGHSHLQPLFRGARLYAIDAESGEELWSSTGWLSGGWRNAPVIADGYLLTQNCYDNQIYCFGKGLTETTVSGPEAVQPLGTKVLIKGTITDQSPGDTCLGIPAAGTAAIADEYMSEWMGYLYMQKPMPTDAEGVEVILTTLDPNGNTYEIGRTTSSDRGMFGCEVELPVPGLYKIIATFEGSNSYYASSAETYVSVTEAPTVAQPIEPEPTTPAPTEPTPTAPEPTEPEPTTPEPTTPEPTTPEPTAPTEAPFITTEVAIIAAVTVAVIIGIVSFWALRKRK